MKDVRTSKVQATGYDKVDQFIFDRWGDRDMKILLVDDHPVFRNGMMTMLGNLFEGAEIVEAGDAAILNRELNAEKR